MTSAHRLHLLEEQQTGVAKKVLAAVPIEEYWTVNQINTEIYRVTHSRIDFHTVQGCLDSLRVQGLVREFPKGCFRRIVAKVKEEPEVLTEVAATPLPAVPAEVPPTDWVTRLSSLGTKLRAAADEIDDIALAVQEEIEDAQKGNAQLKQLQTLLKGLGA